MPGSDYRAFLASKRLVAPSVGIEVAPGVINPKLFLFQRDLTRWALRKGRAAIFADTGLGKSFMQIEWARLTGERTLIIAPLSVARQTVGEARKLGLDVHYTRSRDGLTDGLNITNYEMIEWVDPEDFGAVVLDESSILKGLDGKTRKKLTEMFSHTPYRLCCTATPAPNDITEIANHAEFLGIMTRAEMLAAFFVHDDQGWRLKGHAEEPFYRWLASWGMSVKKPSDLGYPDGEYELPPIGFYPVWVQADYVPDGQLFATGLRGIQDRVQVRKSTLHQRVAVAAEIVNYGQPDQWIVWCGLNDEGRELHRLIPDSVEVTGSDSIEWKEAVAQWFDGSLCICNLPGFRDKLPAWKRHQTPTINGVITKNTERQNSLNPASTNANMPKNGEPITLPTMLPTETGLLSRSKDIASGHESNGKSSEQPITLPTETLLRTRSKDGKLLTPNNEWNKDCESMASPRTTIDVFSQINADAVPSAGVMIPETGADTDSMLTMTMKPDWSAGSFAQDAISGSGSSKTIQSALNGQHCICGHQSGRRILISKTAIFGHGMNWQNCHRMVFVGLSDSWEQYYQAIRRCYRFGQREAVAVYIVLSDAEREIYENVLRKDAEAETMSRRLIEHVRQFEQAELETVNAMADYQPKEGMVVPDWMTA